MSVSPRAPKVTTVQRRISPVAAQLQAQLNRLYLTEPTVLLILVTYDDNGFRMCLTRPDALYYYQVVEPNLCFIPKYRILGARTSIVALSKATGLPLTGLVNNQAIAEDPTFIECVTQYRQLELASVDHYQRSRGHTLNSWLKMRLGQTTKPDKASKADRADNRDKRAVLARMYRKLVPEEDERRRSRTINVTNYPTKLTTGKWVANPTRNLNIGSSLLVSASLEPALQALNDLGELGVLSEEQVADYVEAARITFSTTVVRPAKGSKSRTTKKSLIPGPKKLPPPSSLGRRPLTAPSPK